MYVGFGFLYIRYLLPLSEMLGTIIIPLPYPWSYCKFDTTLVKCLVHGNVHTHIPVILEYNHSITIFKQIKISKHNPQVYPLRIFVNNYITNFELSDWHHYFNICNEHAHSF
jgi:hypothetical protein